MTDWQIKRGDQQFPAPDAATLRAWAQQGRVTRTDYVYNPTLQRWMYASELQELAGIFPPMVAPRGTAARSSCGLAFALFLFAVMLGMMGIGSNLGMFLGAGAIFFALMGAILYVLRK